MVSSHVLDEVERFGSRILVIAQGRLAAEGDFRAIRDLMDDRPHRLRLVSDAAPALAAALLARAWWPARGVTGPDRAEVETTDIHRFRREVAVAARDPRRSASTRWCRSTTTSTACSATWWAGER